MNASRWVGALTLAALIGAGCETEETGGTSDAGSGAVDTGSGATSDAAGDAAADSGGTPGADTVGSTDVGLTDTLGDGTAAGPDKKTALLSIATIIAPDLPIQFISVSTYTPNADPTTGGTIHFELQPLQTAPGKATREPVGDVIEADGTVDGKGGLILDVGTQQVVGDANPVSGSDIEATLKLIGRVVSPDLSCGTIQGSVTKPFEAPLAGSTWAAITITDTTPANLPDPVGKCPGDGPDTDAVSHDVASHDVVGHDVAPHEAGTWDAGAFDAGAPVTFEAVWAILESYSCTNGYCHGSGAGYLQMSSQEGAYAALYAVDSFCDGTKLVDPGNAAASLLYLKVVPGKPSPCGAKMPKDAGEMDADDALVIRKWIEAGAMP
ncbi:MAG: hypothetical protein AMXMBFR64_08070 [Myxococcales bacterium]